jgi:hypothetical protein
MDLENVIGILSLQNQTAGRYLTKKSESALLHSNYQYQSSTDTVRIFMVRTQWCSRAQSITTLEMILLIP